MRIVVADDSEIIKQRIRERLLKIKNITIVGEVASGPEALRELKEKMPDMLILDIRMPEMSGIEVLKKIRSNDAFSGCRVCMLTNYPYKQYRDKCREEGADFFFDKNKEFNALIETITELSKSINKT